MNKSKNVPKIRFEGFSGEWENKKLGEIFLYEQPNKYIVSIANYSDDYKIPVLTAGQSFILGYTNEGYGIKNASKDFPVIIFDDFTTSSHYVDFPFKVKSSAMKILTTDNKKYSFYYLYTVLKNINYKPICHERQWISIFSNFNILIPKLKEEQKLIGQYFSNIDNLIKLQQQKYEKLLNLKKSLLYKLFPKEGETVPELRFEGFSGKWEKKKLGEVLTYRNGKAHEKNIVTKGKFIVVNSKFVSTKGAFVKFSNIQIQPLYKNEIVFVLSDVPNGKAIAKTFLIDIDNVYTLNQRIAGLKVTEAFNPYFVYLLLNKNEYFLKFDDGVNQTNLSKKDVIEFETFYPNINEQTLIGQYFSKLDKLIELNKEKLEKLKNVKESLLDKMFV